MLVLKRKEGQWVEVKHKSGDTLRIRVYNVRVRPSGQADLAFEDGPRNFEIQRPERATTEGPGGAGAVPARGGAKPRRAADRPQRTAVPAPHPLRPLAHCLVRRAAGHGRTGRSS